MKYRLAELFNSFQGEFPFIGRYSTFIRFYRCNYNCSFCDTMYTPHVIKFEEFDYEDIRQLVQKTNFVTFTGGEPLLFTEEISSITANLLQDNIFIDRICLETNGAYLNKTEDVLNALIPYFGYNFHERVSVIWSPKFLDDKSIATMFSSLYESYIPKFMYIKIVAVPEWKDIIKSFLDKAFELYGATIKSKTSLMFLTNPDGSFNQDSLKLALDYGEKYNINITTRLHVQLNLK